ncbi:hypothetical protein GCM10009853_093110 [Glycomyces scopariae]
MSTSTRATRVAATRDAIITTAERLFAEHGVAAVSNRQISEAAGQGNNTAVGYHFGTKGDLVRAIAERHLARIEAARIERIAALPDEPGLREWVECFVMPTMDHLGTLGERTWFARFAAQVLAEPSTREVIADQAMGAPSLRQVTAGLDRCLPDLPAEVLSERKEMVAQLAVVVPAVREARLAAGASTARDTWHEAGLGLVDAIVGLYEAEYTGPRELPAGALTRSSTAVNAHARSSSTVGSSVPMSRCNQSVSLIRQPNPVAPASSPVVELSIGLDPDRGADGLLQYLEFLRTGGERSQKVAWQSA